MAKPHKVFGIGLNKTGTSSLKRALVTLGYNHCNLRGQMTHKFFNENYGEIYSTVENFNSFEDWPWPLMYEQLFTKYGNSARYFLTRRLSSEDWLDSLKAHSLITNPDNNPRKRIFGFDYPHGTELAHLDYYERHLANVRQFFEDKNASHLLCEVCWEEGDGWQKICDFLDEPLPDAKFPHVNRRADASPDLARLRENERRIGLQLKRLNGEP